MSPREARAIRNEELFREVNVHIAELVEEDSSGQEGGVLALVCECEQVGCAVPVVVDPATCEQVRAKPLRFFVTSGHEDLSVESVVERRDSYLIVEKHNA